MKITDKIIEEVIRHVNKHGKRCVHGHTQLSHRNCPPAVNQDKLCFLDIEAFGLDADWGQVLCWVIMDTDGKIYSDVRKGNTDKSVVKSCLTRLKDYDVVVHHYGRRFDMPYLITRALINHLPTPARTELKQIDLWRVCRDRLKLARNSQASLAIACRGKSRKRGVDAFAWSRAALQKDTKALSQILEHCKNDVADLYDNYQAIQNQIGRANY